MENAINALVTDPVMQLRLAKYMALRCFRNTVLEDLHGGTPVESETGDYSDVTVQSPSGVIPWNEVSRISDAEMKVLMIDVVNCSYKFIHEFFDVEKGGQLLLELAEKDPAPQWDTPKLPAPFVPPEQ